jgi:hypothetical protein
VLSEAIGEFGGKTLGRNSLLELLANAAWAIPAAHISGE